MIKRREAHADLEAHEQAADDEFIDKVCVNFQEGNVVDGECDEQKQSEDVRPNVDLSIKKEENVQAMINHCTN